MTNLVQQARVALTNNYELTYIEDKLSVFGVDKKPFFIDFLASKMAFRLQSISIKNELIAKACLVKESPKIIDLTAGLGRDAFLLAYLGAQVLMIERNPILAALLEDALRRLKGSPIGESVQLELSNQDSLHYIDKASVVYLDPMHPNRTKSALVKQDLRMVKEWVGEDKDKEQLFEHAFTLAKKRVVLKWPQKAAAISSKKPSFVYNGRSTRFEVYLTQGG